MDFVDGLADLFDVQSDLLLWHWLAAFQLMVELTPCTYLQNNEDVGLVVKVPIHLDNVRVVEENLNFKLPDKLLNDLFLLQQLLLYHFHCAYESCALLPMMNDTSTSSRRPFHTCRLQVPWVCGNRLNWLSWLCLCYFSCRMNFTQNLYFTRLWRGSRGHGDFYVDSLFLCQIFIV